MTRAERDAASSAELLRRLIEHHSDRDDPPVDNALENVCHIVRMARRLPAVAARTKRRTGLCADTH
jgi:hypothetical protein